MLVAFVPWASVSCILDPFRMRLLLQRLGWEQLKLEPEYITDRVVDAMQCIDAIYELREREDSDGTQFFVHAQLNDVSFRLSVSEDADGHARVQSTRVSGDTFAYHDIFRQIRGMLGDAVGEPSGGAPKRLGGGFRLAGGAGGLGLAPPPMRSLGAGAPLLSSKGAAAPASSCPAPSAN